MTTLFRAAAKEVTAVSNPIFTGSKTGKTGSLSLVRET